MSLTYDQGGEKKRESNSSTSSHGEETVVINKKINEQKNINKKEGRKNERMGRNWEIMYNTIGMLIAGVHLIGWDVFRSMKHGGPGIDQVANLSKVLLAGSYEDSCYSVMLLGRKSFKAIICALSSELQTKLLEVHLRFCYLFSLLIFSLLWLKELVSVSGKTSVLINKLSQSLPAYFHTY